MHVHTRDVRAQSRSRSIHQEHVQPPAHAIKGPGTTLPPQAPLQGAHSAPGLGQSAAALTLIQQLALTPHSTRTHAL